MQRDKITAWSLTALIAAAILVPALLLVYATWVNNQSLDGLAGERTERTLDVLQEHALRVLRTTERILYEAGELVDASSALPEFDLHHRLAELQTAVPEIQAIWAFNKSGRPIVSSSIYPAPTTLDNSDRDYFQVQAKSDIGTAIGENISAKIGNLVFFVISRRLPARDGGFNGIVAISMSPENLNIFYEKLAKGTGLAASLLRDDGSILARYPVPASGLIHARTNSTFQEAIRRSDVGSYSAISGVDNVKRRISYRKVEGYPLYVAAALEENIFRQELINGFYRDLAFGLPAALLLIITAFVALQRTKMLVREFSRRERAEAALKQAQRLEALGQLTGGVAHDFNNLLMVIQGSARRLQREIDMAKRERAVAAILEASRRGESLVKHLLSFSRKQTVRPDVLLLNEKIPQMTDMLRTSLRGDIELSVQLDEVLWPIEADLAEFELALLNIAVNARDAMPNGGAFTIKAQNVDLDSVNGIKLNGDGVKLSLKDSGIGISKESLTKVFEPFYTTKEVGKGTGLGLSQVYGFVSQAGGAAVVESNEGEGTTISLFFPRSARPVSKSNSSFLEVPSQGRRLTILVVDDNAEIRNITSSTLSESGHRVLTASNGAIALDLLTQKCGEIDLVFSDIAMPGRISGVDLAREIGERYANIPVILASGYSVEAQKAARDGIIVLAKPYQVDELEVLFARIKAKKTPT